MGRWGHMPQECDDAWDIYELALDTSKGDPKKFNRKFEEAALKLEEFSEENPELFDGLQLDLAILGAIVLSVENMAPIDPRWIKVAVETLDGLLASDAAEGWKESPGKIRRDWTALRDRLKGRSPALKNPRRR